MLPDRVSNPGPLTYEAGALPIALRGLAPLVTDMPCMDQSPDPIEQELPDLYPSCAVTRAMAKKAMLTENQSDVDLTDYFIDQSFTMRLLSLFRTTCLNIRQT